jgi:hypothetical protein
VNLRRLIRDLRALRRACQSDRGPILRDDAPASLETLWARPCARTDGAGYVRPRADTYEDVARWLYGDQTRGWWNTEPNEVALVAALLMEWRDRLDECRHGWTTRAADRD